MLLIAFCLLLFRRYPHQRDAGRRSCCQCSFTASRDYARWVSMPATSIVTGSQWKMLIAAHNPLYKNLLPSRTPLFSLSSLHRNTNNCAIPIKYQHRLYFIIVVPKSNSRTQGTRQSPSARFFPATEYPQARLLCQPEVLIHTDHHNQP